MDFVIEVMMKFGKEEVVDIVEEGKKQFLEKEVAA
jgi:hypothetical protein